MISGRKIIFICAYWHDVRWQGFVGATVKVRDLAQNLAGEGCRVVAFLPRYRFDRKGLPFRIVELPFVDLPILRFLSFNIALAAGLLRFHLKHRPDAVFVRRMGSILPALYARLARCILFFDVNDDPYHKTRHEGGRFIFRIRRWVAERGDELNLRLCNRAFVINRALADKLIRRIKGAGLHKKILINASGANTDLFVPISEKICRRRLNLSLDHSYIGFIGTLLKHQGIEILMEAAPEILKNRPDTIFLIVGEGPLRNALMERATSLGLDRCFLFPGAVRYEDAPLWIGASDICISPMTQAAGLRSPVKIFDYLASGRPVVASRINGTTTIFKSSEAVVFTEPGDAGELADAIILLLEDGSRRRRMGREARSFVVRRFDRRLLAVKILEQIGNLQENNAVQP